MYIGLDSIKTDGDDGAKNGHQVGAGTSWVITVLPHVAKLRTMSSCNKIDPQPHMRHLEKWHLKWSQLISKVRISLIVNEASCPGLAVCSSASLEVRWPRSGRSGQDRGGSSYNPVEDRKRGRRDTRSAPLESAFANYCCMEVSGCGHALGCRNRRDTSKDWVTSLLW